MWISPNSQVSHYLAENKIKYQQIPFYVSPEIFKKLDLSKEDIVSQLGWGDKNLNDKIIICSFQRDSLGKNLQKPKWQKNPDFLIEICKKLPKKDFILLLAGPRRHYIISQCKKFSIPYVFFGDESCIENGLDDMRINNLSEEKINLLYNLADVCLVTSSSEGGPKAILEASLAKTLVFSTPVGFAPEFLHPDLLMEKDQEQKVIQFVLWWKDHSKIVEEYLEFNFNRVLSRLEKNNYLALLLEAIKSV